MCSEELNMLATRTLDAAFRVHTYFGPGLLESAYSACMVHELVSDSLNVRTEVPVPFIYQGVKLTEVGFRIDILVENELVVEVKSVEGLAAVHHLQLISYLKLSDRRLGLLINFNVERLKDGIHRKVNRF